MSLSTLLICRTWPLFGSTAKNSPEFPSPIIEYVILLNGWKKICARFIETDSRKNYGTVGEISNNFSSAKFRILPKYDDNRMSPSFILLYAV